MNTNTPQGMSTLQDKRTGAGMYWSAAESARRCGVSRATIDRAIKAGKLAAEKDDEGAWRISPHALAEAGLNPGKPSPPEDEKRDRDDDAQDRVRQLEAELAVQHMRASAAETLAAERAERIVDLRQALRQLEQGESSHTPPGSTQAAEQAAPIPSHTPNHAGPSTGKWRKAWNVWRYG